jgi:hypothetical protein
MDEFTCECACMARPTREMQQLLAAVHGDPDAMNEFVRVFGGVVSPVDLVLPGQRRLDRRGRGLRKTLSLPLRLEAVCQSR